MEPSKNSHSCLISARQLQLQLIADSFKEVDGIEYTVLLTRKDTTPPNELNHVLPMDEGLHFRSWSLH